MDWGANDGGKEPKGYTLKWFRFRLDTVHVEQDRERVLRPFAIAALVLCCLRPYA